MANSWAEYNASKFKPVKGYPNPKRIQAPRAAPIEVKEMDWLSRTGTFLKRSLQR